MNGPAGKRRTFLETSDEFAAVLRDRFGLPTDGLDVPALFEKGREQTRTRMAGV